MNQGLDKVERGKYKALEAIGDAVCLENDVICIDNAEGDQIESLDALSDAFTREREYNEAVDAISGMFGLDKAERE